MGNAYAADRPCAGAEPHLQGGEVNDLDLSCVAKFLVVLEEGHYGRAAARLHLSTSAVSRCISRLERQVGVTLLERDASGTVGPTAPGLRFAQKAEPLLAAAREAREAARS